MSSSNSDSEIYSSDEELQEAFANGLLKPGLNTVVHNEKQDNTNNKLIKQKLSKMSLKLPWIERLDLINSLAPLAPELALQMQEQEIKRAKQLKGNRKLPQFSPSEDPVLNDFRRETTFHRQAQGAVIEGIARLRKLKLPTIRPDDYFAEMVKSDEQMQKVRENTMKKQFEVQRSEKVRQLRAQSKVNKHMQIEATLKKHAEKRQMLEEVKKYRKGKRQDLSFLDGKSQQSKSDAKQKMKNKKFGFGGKKKDSKRNTTASSADVSEYRRPIKGTKIKGHAKRLGKSRRVIVKGKKK
ncbi:probable rRNA-processing protein EBP2 homolog [Leptopilina heterotoma]|uniref:probable rRNA-processing protein EBP2 homolog n=1 Tax=Leptopilina heterotoma TaxID=63436 RepID=UPI001CA88330|nr:probable rRNA-processing protein EBP2 homolog [Leptopilina heterotoma]